MGEGSRVAGALRNAASSAMRMSSCFAYARMLEIVLLLVVVLASVDAGAVSGNRGGAFASASAYAGVSAYSSGSDGDFGAKNIESQDSTSGAHKGIRSYSDPGSGTYNAVRGRKPGTDDITHPSGIVGGPSHTGDHLNNGHGEVDCSKCRNSGNWKDNDEYYEEEEEEDEPEEYDDCDDGQYRPGQHERPYKNHRGHGSHRGDNSKGNGVLKPPGVHKIIGDSQTVGSGLYDAPGGAAGTQKSTGGYGDVSGSHPTGPQLSGTWNTGSASSNPTGSNTWGKGSTQSPSSFPSQGSWNKGPGQAHGIPETSGQTTWNKGPGQAHGIPETSGQTTWNKGHGTTLGSFGSTRQPTWNNGPGPAHKSPGATVQPSWNKISTQGSTHNAFPAETTPSWNRPSVTQGSNYDANNRPSPNRNQGYGQNTNLGTTLSWSNPKVHTGTHPNAQSNPVYQTTPQAITGWSQGLGGHGQSWSGTNGQTNTPWNKGSGSQNGGSSGTNPVWNNNQNGVQPSNQGPTSRPTSPRGGYSPTTSRPNSSWGLNTHSAYPGAGTTPKPGTYWNQVSEPTPSPTFSAGSKPGTSATANTISPGNGIPCTATPVKDSGFQPDCNADSGIGTQVTKLTATGVLNSKVYGVTAPGTHFGGNEHYPGSGQPSHQFSITSSTVSPNYYSTYQSATSNYGSTPGSPTYNHGPNNDGGTAKNPTYNLETPKQSSHNIGINTHRGSTLSPGYSIGYEGSTSSIHHPPQSTYGSGITKTPSYSGTGNFGTTTHHLPSGNIPGVSCTNPRDCGTGTGSTSAPGNFPTYGNNGPNSGLDIHSGKPGQSVPGPYPGVKGSGVHGNLTPGLPGYSNSGTSGTPGFSGNAHLGASGTPGPFGYSRPGSSTSPGSPNYGHPNTNQKPGSSTYGHKGVTGTSGSPATDITGTDGNSGYGGHDQSIASGSPCQPTLDQGRLKVHCNENVGGGPNKTSVPVKGDTYLNPSDSIPGTPIQPSTGLNLGDQHQADCSDRVFPSPCGPSKVNKIFEPAGGYDLLAGQNPFLISASAAGKGSEQGYGVVPQSGGNSQTTLYKDNPSHGGSKGLSQPPSHGTDLSPSFLGDGIGQKPIGQDNPFFGAGAAGTNVQLSSYPSHGGNTEGRDAFRPVGKGNPFLDGSLQINYGSDKQFVETGGGVRGVGQGHGRPSAGTGDHSASGSSGTGTGLLGVYGGAHSGSFANAGAFGTAHASSGSFASASASSSASSGAYSSLFPAGQGAAWSKPNERNGKKIESGAWASSSANAYSSAW